MANVIGPIIAMGLNNLDYAYGLITGISSPEDDPEVYQKDRENILKNLRVEILGKKPLKESEEK